MIRPIFELHMYSMKSQKNTKIANRGKDPYEVMILELLPLRGFFCAF
jgi:hypothetical protein